MTPKNTTRNARTLQIRRYTTKLKTEEVRHRIGEATTTEPLLNESFLTETVGGDFVLSGLKQVGDILVRLDPAETGSTLLIEFRKGDQALADLLQRRFGKDARVQKNPPDFNPLAFEDMAQLFQTMRRMPAGRVVMISEAAIESALLCRSEEYPAVVEALDFLRSSTRAERIDAAEPLACGPRLRQLRVEYRGPAVVLHQGVKLRLPHRIQIPSSRGDTALRLHFARLPLNRYLVGFVDEVASEF